MAVQNIHILVVILFLILFMVKAFLLFTNKHQTLEKIKKSTRIFDIVFGTLILVTGGYLLMAYPEIPTWLILKIVVVLAAIPVAIMGIRKHNKPMVALGLIMFIYVYGVAESKSLTMQPETNSEETINAEPEANPETTPEEEVLGPPAIADQMTETSMGNAKAIYTQQCATCHGEDGTKEFGGATTLRKSATSVDERKAIILDGKGMMPAFRGKLSEQEAEEIAVFTQTLK